MNSTQLQELDILGSVELHLSGLEHKLRSKHSSHRASSSIPDEDHWEGSSRSGVEASVRPEWEHLHLSLIEAASSGDAQLTFIVRYAQTIGPAAQCHIFLNKPCRNRTLTPCTYGLHGSHLSVHLNTCKHCVHVHTLQNGKVAERPARRFRRRDPC